VDDYTLPDIVAVENLGWPLLVKASSGGGGRGMRVVWGSSELTEAIVGAQREAEAAFGDSTVFLERYLRDPRHIEVQVLADAYGDTVALFERECSIQRRHQKIIEEAPSPAVTPQLRARLVEAAVTAARHVGYVNAGTVEFVVDRDGEPFFLEMNTRLQVEHPVTELVTGHDLVHLQIRIAQGEPLPFTQKDVQLRGHAIECRIYAEDPANGFMPSPGRITRLLQPGGPGIREDSGIYEGWVVPVDYDPMLSKLIAYAPTRDLAIARLLRALDEYVIGGIRTNLALFRRILTDPDFRAARIDTGYLDRLLAAAPSAQAIGSNGHGDLPAVAAAALFEATKNIANGSVLNGNGHASPWKSAARRDAVGGTD
jgi:acetyl-CoA carboxylase biotin carboxylase subunit